MISYAQIQRLSSTQGVSEDVIEKDYFIELLLFYLSDSSIFVENAIFRGGTCLKKIYFPGYRFSEDLDFILKDMDILHGLKEIFNRIFLKISEDYLFKPTLSASTKNGRFQAFFKYNIVPEIRSNKELKVDILQDNYIPGYSRKSINFTYADFKNIEKNLNTYNLESIASDKIARILDVDKEARDIYDLWYILNTDFLSVPILKNELKKRFGFIISFTDLIKSIKSDVYKQTWKIRLENQVHDLPGFERVISDIEGIINKNFL